MINITNHSFFTESASLFELWLHVLLFISGQPATIKSISEKIKYIKGFLPDVKQCFYRSQVNRRSLMNEVDRSLLLTRFFAALRMTSLRSG